MARIPVTEVIKEGMAEPIVVNVRDLGMWAKRGYREVPGAIRRLLPGLGAAELTEEERIAVEEGDMDLNVVPQVPKIPQAVYVIKAPGGLFLNFTKDEGGTWSESFQAGKTCTFTSEQEAQAFMEAKALANQGCTVQTAPVPSK